MPTLREFGLTEASLDSTVNPATLDELVDLVVTMRGGAVYLVDGMLIFAPDNAPAYWDSQEPTPEMLLSGLIDGWERDRDTKIESFTY